MTKYKIFSDGPCPRVYSLTPVARTGYIVRPTLKVNQNWILWDDEEIFELDGADHGRNVIDVELCELEVQNDI